MLYRTPPRISTKAYPIPEYGYDVRTDLTELSGKGMKVLTLLELDLISAQYISNIKLENKVQKG